MESLTFVSHSRFDGEKDFPEFVSAMHERGYRFTSDLKSAKNLIAFNHSNRVLKRIRKFRGSNYSLVLVRLEPRTVFATQYKRAVEKNYGLVITMGSIDDNESHGLRWPYYVELNPLKPDAGTRKTLRETVKNLSPDSFKLSNWKQRPTLLSFIASNKVSATKVGNYSIRRDFVRELSYFGMETFGELWTGDLADRIKHRMSVGLVSLSNGQIPNVIELWGDLNRSYKNTFGSVQDKHQVLVNSKFSLIVENDSHYVSEKLIDALLAGTIPFYVGGGLSRVGIPHGLVEEVRSPREVIDFITKSNDSEVSRRLERICRFIANREFIDQWSGEEVYKRLAIRIDAHLRDKKC